MLPSKSNSKSNSKSRSNSISVYTYMNMYFLNKDTELLVLRRSGGSGGDSDGNTHLSRHRSLYKYIPGLLSYNETLLSATRFELKMTAHLSPGIKAAGDRCPWICTFPSASH